MNTVTRVEARLVDVSTVPTDLFIDGSWRPAASGARIDVFNPATEEVLATVADASLEEGAAAVDAAASAAAGWAATPPRRRSEILLQAFQKMRAKSDWLAELI